MYKHCARWQKQGVPQFYLKPNVKLFLEKDDSKHPTTGSIRLTSNIQNENPELVYLKPKIKIQK